MIETTAIRTAFDDGTVTADFYPAPKEMDPVTCLIRLSFVSDIGKPYVTWLEPNEAVNLAHQLLTLAYTAGEEIAE
jgi:hypothetical protein